MALAVLHGAREVRLKSKQAITVRLALPADVTALEALQWRASLNNPGDRDALLSNPDAIELPLSQIEDGNVFVAEMAGAAIGFAAILGRDDGDVELDGLFVEPQAWRQGIGRVLVDHCAEVAFLAGASCLHVVGNPHAAHFYGACGFKRSSIEQTRFGVGLLLRKALD